MWGTDRLRMTLFHCRALVWMAGFLVPTSERVTWQITQNRRFWHWCHFLSESKQLNAENRLLISRAAWQLFPDALWLRFNRDATRLRYRRLLGSPVISLSMLTVAAVALAWVSGALSTVRMMSAEPVPDPAHLVLITLDAQGMNGKWSRTRSDTLLDLASVWSKAQAAKGLSPFSWAPTTLLLPNRDLPVAMARVGPNFFTTLAVKPALGRILTPEDASTCSDCVVLSDSLWRHELHADPNILGKTIVLHGSPRMVVGVLPQAFRIISPGIAVWGLIDPDSLFTNFQRRVGAIARLGLNTTPQQLQRELSDRTESAGYIHPSSLIEVVTSSEQARRNLKSLAGFVLLTSGCAVLVVWLRRSSNGLGRMPDQPARRALWLCFLAAKSVLVLGVAFFAAWAAVHWLSAGLAGSTSPFADEYSVWLYLPLAIAALSWAIRDQQRRCRRCLLTLELPVEIGLTGSVLLNWSGTEMVCPLGHGVLYLPDTASNSLDEDRWSEFDDSWQNLFRAG